MPYLPESFTRERVCMSITSFRFHNGPKRNTGPYPERKYSALIASFLQSRSRLRARNGLAPGPRLPPGKEGCPGVFCVTATWLKMVFFIDFIYRIYIPTYSLKN